MRIEVQAAGTELAMRAFFNMMIFRKE